MHTRNYLGFAYRFACAIFAPLAFALDAAFARVSRAVSDAMAYAFPVLRTYADAVHFGLASEIIAREPERQRAKTYVSRRLARSTDSSRSAPLSMGDARAGLALA